VHGAGVVERSDRVPHARPQGIIVLTGQDKVAKGLRPRHRPGDKITAVGDPINRLNARRYDLGHGQAQGPEAAQQAILGRRARPVQPRPDIDIRAENRDHSAAPVMPQHEIEPRMVHEPGLAAAGARRL